LKLIKQKIVLNQQKKINETLESTIYKIKELHLQNKNEKYSIQEQFEFILTKYKNKKEELVQMN
jgi:hypothetical protein